MNHSRPPKPELSSGVRSHALPRIVYWALLLVHALAGVVLLVMLGWFVPKFEGLFERLQQRGELPPLTAFVLLLSKHSYWLLPLGFAVDAAVLYVLGRLSKTPWRPVIAWFSLVLIAMALLYVLTIVGLLLPVQRMSATI